MVSETTEAGYKRCLEYIKSAGIDYKSIESVTEYIKSIHGMRTKKGSLISEASVKIYLVSTLWYLTENKGDKEVITEIKMEIKRIREAIDKEVSTHKLIGTQKENYIKWDEVMEVYNMLKLDYKKTSTKYKTYVLLSCYVLMAPRRLRDYALMDIVDKESEELNKARNYYVKSAGYFIFNNYKTAKTYKCKKIKLTDEHKKIMNEYIEDKSASGSLFNMSGDAIQAKLARLFKGKKDKRVSVNILRHSYISWLKDNGKLGEDNNIWLIMGHSKGMQNEYYKKCQNTESDDDDEESEESEKGNEIIVMENMYK